MSLILKPAPSQPEAPACVFPWWPDQGDGTYCNPVLFADYSDPDVIRDGQEFWMTASSFHCTPGLPILHSHDLVNWKLVNHALKNVPGERYRQVQPGCGVWAPSLRFHDGRFWIFFATPDEGIYVTTAAHPAGGWSEPHLVQAGRGLIDPCPLWDDDGRAYLVHAYAGSRAGIKHRLRICPMAPDGSRLLGEGQVVFHQPERHPTIEGPKFLKRNGWYYLLAPAGGVKHGWQTALRSKNVFGPYQDRIVLEQGATPVNGPHQGALVDSTDGRWWFVHFQDAGVYGRVVHLQPVQWNHDWPEIGMSPDDAFPGQPVPRFQKPFSSSAPELCTPGNSDEFDAPRLGLQWQWHANHSDDWYSLAARPGWLRLFAQPLAGKLGHAPHLLLQKFPAREFTIETCVALEPAATAGIQAGLVVVGSSCAALVLRPHGHHCEIAYFEDDKELTARTLPGRTARLRVEVAPGGECAFAFATESGQWVALPRIFQARPGVWIGSKTGLVTWSTGHPSHPWADFDFFRFSGPVSFLRAAQPTALSHGRRQISET